jgi:predicted transposase YbfD/YdcC
MQVKMRYNHPEERMMDIINSLQEMTKEAEEGTEYQGYWYSIIEVLIIVVCGKLWSLQSINDIYEWSKATPVRKFFKERFGIEKISCKAQFYNILACVNAEKFNMLFIKWMRSVLHGGLVGKTIAIDGKTICSTDKLTEDGSSIHIASAIVSEYGMVIGSRECGTKTGETNAFRELISLLDLSGAIVVADALHCKKKSAKSVVETGADYLFVVKDNEPTLKDDIALYVQEETLEKHITTEKNGGRIETRTAYVTRKIDWLYGRESWINLSCVGAIHTEFEKAGKKSSEWHYYISSAPLTAENLLKHARLEWGIEAMHWLLDVNFAEDKTRVWNMNVQKLLNTLRKIAINLAKDYKAKTKSRLPLSGILKRNLFDIANLEGFLEVIAVN